MSNMPRASHLRQQRQVETAINPPEPGTNFSANKTFLYIFLIQKTDLCKIYHIGQIL